MRIRFGFTVPIVLILLVILAACGGDDNEPEATPSPTATEQTVGTPSHVSAEAETDADGAESFTKPTPPGGVPTAEPPPESSFDSDGDGWLNWDELQSAVHTTFPQYEWPPNYTTDAETLLARREAGTNARGPGVEKTNFESGAEYSIPGETNMCAWVYAWLDAYADGDQATMDESMVHIEKQIAELWSLSGIRQDLEADLNRAKLGDIAGLQQLSVMFCDPDVFTQSASDSLNHPSLMTSLREDIVTS